MHDRREEWFVIAIALVALALAVIWWVVPVRAHDAPSGWHYAPECCSDADCALAETVEELPDKSLKVTTIHGTAVFPANFPKKDSPDGRIHACFVTYADGSQRLYCLYYGSGI